MRRPDFLSLILALVTGAVFLPVAWNDFVNYDDPDYVTANAHVQGGLNWKNVAWAFTTGHASNWHPITWLSHMLDYQFFGPQPAGHHLVNAAFHVMNTLLLFLLLARMTTAIWRSALVAGLFALHPLHVESVAWISERKDVLSAFFWMLTILAYAGYVSRLEPRQTDSPLQKVKRIRSTPASLFYALSLTFFVMGLMSKPMMVTLPFVLLLLDYWPLERAALNNLHGKESVSTKSKSTSIRGLPWLFLEKPFVILSGVSCYVTFVVQRKGGAVSTSISIGARIANALVAYARYIGKFLWPEKLSVLYPHPGSWPAWQVAAAGILVLVLCLSAVILARRRPYIAVGWFWFFGTLVPMIGLVQVGVQSMADRYTYVPLIGLLIVLVWGVADLVTAKIARQQGPKPGSFDFGGEQAPISDADSFLRTGFKVVIVWVALVLIACIVLTSRRARLMRQLLTETALLACAWRRVGHQPRLFRSGMNCCRC